MMTLKEKIVQSNRLSQLQLEKSIYDDAVKSGSKFSEYYSIKAAALDAVINAMTSSS